MKVMALVPARAGSKRLRNKNVAELGGLPLWRHAVAHARSSGVVDHVVVSTNDPGIHWDGSFSRLTRPDHLCTDDATTVDVVRHAHMTMPGFDAICILQPTSPFRTGADIAACVELMTSNPTAVESVVSFSEAPDDLIFRERHAGRVEAVKGGLIPNGAIFLVRTDVLLLYGDAPWYGPYCYSYVMPRERGLDVNVQFDLDVAKLYLPKMRVADEPGR